MGRAFPTKALRRSHLIGLGVLMRIHGSAIFTFEYEGIWLNSIYFEHKQRTELGHVTTSIPRVKMVELAQCEDLVENDVLLAAENRAWRRHRQAPQAAVRREHKMAALRIFRALSTSSASDRRSEVVFPCARHHFSSCDARRRHEVAWVARSTSLSPLWVAACQ